MNRIDVYISGLFWKYFLGGLSLFVILFCAIDAMGNLVTYEHVAVGDLLRYYLFYGPEVIYRMFPVGCLLATIFTLSTLNRSNELVALFSCGMSLVRIAASILFWVILISGVGFVLSDKVLPQFAKQKNYVFYNDIYKKPNLYSLVKTDRIWYRSKNTIFNIKTMNQQANKAQGFTLYYFNDNWDLMQMITAKEVDMIGSHWNLSEGSVTVFTEDSSFPLTSNFKKKTIVMEEDSRDLSATAKTSDVLTLSELSQYIQKNKEAGLDTVRYEVDYDSKYGYSCAALVLCLLGIPFSIAQGRSGGMMINVSICIGLVLVYYIFYSSAITLGNFGQIPPIVAAWFPNFVMGGFAWFNINRSKR